MRERLVPYSAARAGNSSICPPASAARSSCVRRSDANAARPGLVRQRDRHLRAPRERLEQPPLRAGQVLESVGEDRSAVPRVELRSKPLDRTAPKQVAIPEAERDRAPLDRRRRAARDLLPVAQARAGRTRAPKSAARSASAKPANRAERPRAIQRCSRENAPRHKCALRITRDGSGIGRAERELAEDVVERADRACEQGAGAPQQVALDPVDVRPVGDDQDRIAVDRREVPLEETRDLAGFRRPEDESQAHLPMVVRAPDAPADEKSGKSGVSPALSPLSGATASPTSAGGRDARPGGRPSSRPRRR